MTSFQHGASQQAGCLPPCRCANLFQSSCPQSHQRRLASCGHRKGAAPFCPSDAGIWSQQGGQRQQCLQASSQYGLLPQSLPHLKSSMTKNFKEKYFRNNKSCLKYYAHCTVMANLFRPLCRRKTPKLQIQLSLCNRGQAVVSCQSAPSCPPTNQTKHLIKRAVHSQ